MKLKNKVEKLEQEVEKLEPKNKGKTYITVAGKEGKEYVCGNEGDRDIIIEVADEEAKESVKQLLLYLREVYGDKDLEQQEEGKQEEEPLFVDWRKK